MAPVPLARAALALALLLLALLLPGAAEASMYQGTEVVELTPKSFKTMLKSKQVWMVEFYAPWCGHCQKLKPEYLRAAAKAKGVVRFAAVDADQHRALGQAHGVKGFPTLKVFGLDKHKPHDYQGARTASAMLDHLLGLLPGGKVRQVRTAQEEAAFTMEPGGAPEAPRLLLFPSKPSVSPLLKSLALEFEGQVVVGQVSAKEGADASALERKYGVSERPALLFLPGGGAPAQELGDDLSHKAIRAFVKSALKGAAGESELGKGSATTSREDKAAPPAAQEPKSAAQAHARGSVSALHTVEDFVSFCSELPGFCVVGVDNEEQGAMQQLLAPQAAKYSEDPFNFASASAELFADVVKDVLNLQASSDGTPGTTPEPPSVVVLNWKRRKLAIHDSELEGAALGSTLDRALGGDLPFTKFALAEP